MSDIPEKCHVVRLIQRLGNQIFQYAFARALETASGVPVLFHNVARRPMLQDCFPHVKVRFTPPGFKLEQLPCRSAIGLAADVYLPDFVTTTEPSYFKGYWQNENHFSAISKTLREELFLPWPEELAARDASLLSRIKSCPESVMVNVRRGDYVRLGWAFGPGYYLRAMEYMRRRVPGCRFFIFSDDPKWCSAEFSGIADAEVVDTIAPPQWQLKVMGECMHAIISNSTFSWWGAWLGRANDGVVVAPDPWLRHCSMPFIIPGRWIRIDSRD